MRKGKVSFAYQDDKARPFEHFESICFVARLLIRTRQSQGKIGNFKKARDGFTHLPQLVSATSQRDDRRGALLYRTAYPVVFKASENRSKVECITNQSKLFLGCRSMSKWIDQLVNKPAIKYSILVRFWIRIQHFQQQASLIPSRLDMVTVAATLG